MVSHAVTKKVYSRLLNDMLKDFLYSTDSLILRWCFPSDSLTHLLSFLSLSILLSPDKRICSPPFMVLNTECGPDTLEKIEKHGLTFPFSKSLPFLFDRGIVT